MTRRTRSTIPAPAPATEDTMLAIQEHATRIMSRAGLVRGAIRDGSSSSYYAHDVIEIRRLAAQLAEAAGLVVVDGEVSTGSHR